MSKICRNCGKILNDNAAFCPECGTKAEAVQGNAVNQMSEPVKTSNKKVWIITASASFVIFVLSIAIVLAVLKPFGGRETYPEAQTFSDTVEEITYVEEETAVITTEVQPEIIPEITAAAETTTTKKPQSEFLTASENDKNKFREMMKKSLSNDQFFFEYNCKSTSTKEQLMERAFLSEFGTKTYDRYFGTDSSTRINGRDPLGRFEEDSFYGTGYQYFKIPKKEAEWVMKNIFNISSSLATDFGPGKKTYDENGYLIDYEMGNNNIYYHDGNYYYYQFFDKLGDGGMCCKSINFTQMSDGKYKIVCKDVIGYEGDGIPEGDLVIVAGLKNIEGNRTWTFYSVEIEE